MIELRLKESLRELTLVLTNAVDTLSHSTQSIGWEALPDQLELEIKLLAMYCHRLSGCEETKCTFHEGKSTLQKIARRTTARELFIGERRRSVLLRRQQTLDSVSVRLRLCLDSVSVHVLCVGSADQSYTSTILSSSCFCLGPPWRRTPEAVHQQPYTRGSSGAAALVVGTACCPAHCLVLRPDLLASREQGKRWRERAAAGCPTSFGGVLHQTPPLSCVAAAAALSEWWNYVVRWKPLPAVLINIQGLLR